MCGEPVDGEDATARVRDDHEVGKVLRESTPLLLAAPQRLLGALALRDVEERHDRARELPAGVEDGLRAEDRPRDVAVLLADAERDRRLRLAGREHARDGVV